jgi:tRNA(Ile2) C34 agmatinyltransferase TiaS
MVIRALSIKLVTRVIWSKKNLKKIETCFSTNQVLNDEFFFKKKTNLQKDKKKTEIVGENA